MTPTSTVRDQRRWQAVRRRQQSADGAFVYAVRTTGVFCRPSCSSRMPRRENVEFFATPTQARRAGYRACLRCKPERDAPEDMQSFLVRACSLLERDEATSNRYAAAELGCSPEHFLRRFKAAMGVTPQAYRRRVRAERAKQELRGARSVIGAALSAGYGSGSRYYAGPARELGMSGRASRAGGSDVDVRYATAKCSLGRVLVAWTERGVCQVALGDDDPALIAQLSARYPAARRVRGERPGWVTAALSLAERPGAPKLPLDIAGTAFQERVWNALQAIPYGETRSYREVAQAIGEPTAARAVARACASNPVALVIPCHRVVRSDGELAGYRWGKTRKRALLAREHEARSEAQTRDKR